MVLEIYNLSPNRNNMSTFSVIRILEEMPSLTWITPKDVLRTKDINLSDILRTRAFLSDQLMVELMDESQSWYTLYLFSNLVIQTQDIFAGGAIVE